MKVNFLVGSIKANNGVSSSALRLAENLKKEGLEISINGKGYDYDIFHIHSPYPFIIPKIKKARKLGVRIISHAHTTADDLKGSFIFTHHDLTLNIFDNYLKYFYNKSDLLLAPSNWTKYTLNKRGIKVPIEVLSNGINLEKFKYDKNKAKDFRVKYKVNDDDIIVYSVGLVFIRKGVETFKKVAQELRDLKFFWIGDKYNSLFTNFMAMKRLFKNLPKNLKFLGYVDNKDFIGAQSTGDIFLFPSFVENQGIAILEAAAFSKAIVLRNLPVYDWAVHEKNCLIAKNDEEFINCVDLLSKDKKLRQKIGTSVKKIAEENNMNKTIKRLINIYENLITP